MSTEQDSDVMVDHSHLNPPTLTARTGVHQLFECFCSGTVEVKKLLLSEADVIFECRLCKSLFRGLANFIDHKKLFCMENFDPGSLFTGSGSDVDVNLDMTTIISKNGKESDISESNQDESQVNSQSSFSNITSTVTAKEVKKGKPIVVLRPMDESNVAYYQGLLKPITSQLINNDSKTASSSGLFQPDTASSSGENQTSVSKLISSSNNNNEIIETNSVSGNQVNKTEINAGEKKELTDNKNPIVEEEEIPGSAYCSICKKNFKNKTCLLWHMRIHSRYLYHCPYCSYYNNSALNLKQHMLHKHQSTPEVINKSLNKNFVKQNPNFLTANDKKKQLTISNQIKVQYYGCKICSDYETNTMRYLRRHIFRSHKTKLSDENMEDFVKLFPIMKINNSEESANKEQKKLNQQNQKYTSVCVTKNLTLHSCQVCNKTFGTKNGIEKHLKNHLVAPVTNSTENLPTQENTLVASSISKSAEKLEIEKAYAAVSSLIDKKKLCCLKCDKKLTSLTTLRRHASIHLGYNRYCCKFCKWKTTDHTSLKRHLQRLHENNFETQDELKSSVLGMRVGIWVSGSNGQLSDSNEVRDESIQLSVDVKNEENNNPQELDDMKLATETKVEENVLVKEVEKLDDCQDSFSDGGTSTGGTSTSNTSGNEIIAGNNQTNIVEIELSQVKEEDKLPLSEFGDISKDVKKEERFIRPPQLKCSRCDKTFISKRNMNRHILTCDGSGKQYYDVITNSSNSLGNKRKKISIKLYTCSNCKKTFSSQAKLSTHLITHKKKTKK